MTATFKWKTHMNDRITQKYVFISNFMKCRSIVYKRCLTKSVQQFEIENQ